MIILGDLQLGKQNPHKQAVFDLFDWLYEKYPNEIFVQVGDFYDTSAVSNDIRSIILNKLKKFKEFHIITGNHDKSDKSKNALLPLQHQGNIFIYDDIKEAVIDGHKCLMLPFQRNTDKVREYEKYNFNGDLIFSHFFHPKKSFNNVEAIDLSSMKANYYIYGHDHTYATIDNHIIIGCVVPASQGQINNPVIEIIDNKLSYIEHPIWFEYEDIIYGQQPKNKNNILNIKDAPSVDSIYDMYKDCYIRDEGITFKSNEDVTINEINFDMSDLSGQFIKFCEQPDLVISNDVKTACLKYLKSAI